MIISQFSKKRQVQNRDTGKQPKEITRFASFNSKLYLYLCGLECQNIFSHVSFPIFFKSALYCTILCRGINGVASFLKLTKKKKNLSSPTSRDSRYIKELFGEILFCLSLEEIRTKCWTIKLHLSTLEIQR